MTKKMVNCSKNIPGHFQDKTVKIVNSRTKKIPGHFHVFQDAWTPCIRGVSHNCDNYPTLTQGSLYSNSAKVQ